jgi:hypothetical protein
MVKNQTKVTNSESKESPQKVYFSGTYNFESEKKMFEHIFNFQFYEVTYMLDAGYDINHQVILKLNL